MLRNGLVMEIATIQIIRVDATGMAAIAAVPQRTFSTAHTVCVEIQNLQVKIDHTDCMYKFESTAVAVMFFAGDIDDRMNVVM